MPPERIYEIRKAAEKELEIHDMEDLGYRTQSGERASAFNSFMKKVRRKVAENCTDIEGEMIGLPGGIQGMSKYRLEKAVNLESYLKRNIKYFKEYEPVDELDDLI